MDCKICANAYSDNNLPMLLQCNHTICSRCIQLLSVKSCPFDRIPIRSSSVNYTLMSKIHSSIGKTVFPSYLLTKLSDLCPNNHILSLTVSRLTCTPCRNPTAEFAWHCGVCNFSICHSCKGEILCPAGHVMAESEGQFRCDGCLEDKNEGGFRCELCDVDICKHCKEKYLRICRRQDVCVKGGTVKWRGNIQKICRVEGKKHFVCTGCKKKVSKFGAFACFCCGNKCCLVCA